MQFEHWLSLSLKNINKIIKKGENKSFIIKQVEL